VHARNPAAGANIAALGLAALAEVMERARLARLTRHQHVLLRLGELIAYAECAARLAERAGAAADGQLNPKSDGRFDASGIATLSRIFAREAAMKVAADGLRWICGAGGVADADIPSFANSLGLPAIHCAQAGLLADMDVVADILYGRAAAASQQAA